MKYLHVADNRSELEAMSQFRRMLYAMDEDNAELLSVYEDLDREISEEVEGYGDNQDELDALKEELAEMKAEIRKLMGGIKRTKKEIDKTKLLDQLKQILL